MECNKPLVQTDLPMIIPAAIMDDRTGRLVDFVVCKECDLTTEEAWEADQVMLRQQGISIPCKWILEQELEERRN